LQPFGRALGHCVNFAGYFFQFQGHGSVRRL
jgi:hypothetical protein